MAANFNKLKELQENPMDFLELLSVDQALQVREVLDDAESTDTQKEKVVEIVIKKNTVALEAFKSWWAKKKTSDVESFLCHLPPIMRNLAKGFLDQGNLIDLEEFLKSFPEALAAFIQWKNQKDERKVCEEDFLSLLTDVLRRFAEKHIGDKDMESLDEVMQSPGATKATPIYEKWKAQQTAKSTTNEVQPPKLERKLSSSTISSAKSEPDLEYSDYAEIPNIAGGHLVGTKGRNSMEIEKKTGCKIGIQRGNEIRPSRYRIGGPNQEVIRKGLQAVITHMAAIQKSEDLVPTPMFSGLCALSEAALLDFQRKSKVYIEKTHNPQGLFVSAKMKAWNYDELQAAKQELSTLIGFNFMPPPPQPFLPNFGGHAPQPFLSNFGGHGFQQPPPPGYNANYKNTTNHLPGQFKPKYQPNVKPEADLKDTREGADISKYPESMNILVLGETGVGKSTFINGLINYFNYDSMDDALKYGVKILIKSSFTLTNENHEQVEIVSEPTSANEQDSRSNEVLGQGQSATQDPKSYRFSFGPPENQKFVRIIDTPGIGDVRGLNQDEKNFEKILQFISQFSEIHAICILMKPNSARLTVVFRFCVDELLTHLHKSASDNLIFCFTNSRSTLYRPGDTLPTLREHLKELEAKSGVQIPTNKDTMFCFDNESFRFLCALKEKFPFTDAEKREFGTSWTKSVDETLRLFHRVTQLPVHKVHDTLSLNNARNVILSLTRPLGEITRQLATNKKLIQDKMAEIERLVSTGASLFGKLIVEQMNISMENLPYPQTVCTAEKCVGHEIFESSSENIRKRVFKTICHAHCHLVGVPVEVCPNTMLQNCSALYRDVEHCSNCGCSWQTHLHIRYKMNQKMVKVEEPTVRDSINKNDNDRTTAEIFLIELRKKIDILNAESEKITAYCAHFASFLAHHSILPYNNSYDSYIDMLIKEGKSKVSHGGSVEYLDQMIKYKGAYQEQVRILKENIDRKDVSLKTADEINKMVADLRSMASSAQILKEIMNLEMLSLREGPAEENVIPMQTSWLSTGVRKAKKIFNQYTNKNTKYPKH